jgi:putative ABC transport system permease protein
MPEFRRGPARWLPREAERDLFHPSLEDLRAQNITGLRLQLAIAALWLECWRVWLFSAGSPARRNSPAYLKSPAKAGRHSDIFPKEYTAMFSQDLRRAFRLFRLEPGFTAAAVLTLALGIGANTALFAVVEAVLLRPLALNGADELVILKHRDTTTGISKEFLAIGDFLDLQTRMQTLQPLATYGGTQGTLFEGDEPARVIGLGATPELFDALRVQPAMGRLINADDLRKGAAPVVMISYQLWETRFGSDPNIIGRGIQLNATRRPVVGVFPRGFHFPPNSPTDYAVPMTLPPLPPSQRKGGWILGMGRLRPGQSIDAVVSELGTLSTEFAQQFPEQNRGTEYFAEPLRDALVGDTKKPLLLLLAAVGFVLLIACANVGNLLLARSLGRRQEMAVRTPLGASWTRLATQVLTEAIVLSLTGGLVGVAIAWQAAPALAALVPETAQIPALRDVGLNVPVVLFSLAVSIAAALLFSAVACISLASNERRVALVSTRGTSMSVGARRAASWLVAGEIALAGILLVGAGLTLRSFSNLIAVDPGFRTSNVLTLGVNVPPSRYPNQQAQGEFMARAFRALEELGEIEHAGAAAVVPLTGNNWTVGFERDDRPVPAGERPPDVGWQAATSGYFAALAIPLKSGRLFDDRDRAAKITPVIISEEIVRRFFPGENPIGHRLKGGDNGLEVVGVVGDIRRAALTDQPRADMYFPFNGVGATVFLKAAGDPMAALPAVRTALKSMEPLIMIHGVRTFDEVASASMAITRLAMRLLAGFAIVAVLLAAIGIYGVMAYSVRRRTREIGTRVALGANRGDIVRLVMREGGVITAAGVLIGLASGLVAARSLSAILYGVPPADPLSLVAAAIVLAITGMAACYLPARRAARVDPARTLTTE